MKPILAFIVVIVLIGVGYFIGTRQNPSALNERELTGSDTSETSPPIAVVSYLCDGGKSMRAAYYNDPTKLSMTPGGPPVPGGRVEVVLSDGRSLELAQTISASGIRYSDGNPSVQGNESFVFWSKGNGALVLENDAKQTYTGCVKVVSDPGGLQQAYASGSQGFSIRYPEGYKLNASYRYQELGPGKDIGGVKFTIPQSITSGTNLVSDSYVSVEEIPWAQGKACTANLFLPPAALGAAKPSTVTDGSMTYSLATSTGAATGNQYEETIYAVSDTNPCIAVRYFIHYGVLENYPPGAVKAFDRAALIKQFDAVRRTLTIN
jgi:hypothetical protein